MDYDFAMHAAANAFLLVYAGLFPIVNPVGSAPIFLALTSGRSAEVRRTLARRVAVNGFILLLGSLFIGSHVLVFFGITVPVLRIAGGLAVASFGWRLLRDGVEPTNDTGDVDEDAPIDAFYPLTMPLTVGPGSISVAIALGAQRPQGITDIAQLALVGGSATAGLAGIAFTVFLCYRSAGRMVSLLGASGISVMVRLSAFILLCIGIQIIWSGYSALAGISHG
ncbi:MAG TPA: MarC family protein [Stellaceae bacterium]|nr:MarC family protein [Stellaceae bacterium]